MLLFLNDVSGSEIVLILVFILIFFGAKSIPGIARTMGRTVRQIKDASNDLQNEIRKSTGDIKKDLNLRSMVEESSKDIRRPLDQMAEELDGSVSYRPSRPTTKFPEAPAPVDDGIMRESLLQPDPDAPKVSESAKPADEEPGTANSKKNNE